MIKFKDKEFKGSEGEFFVTDYSGYISISDGFYYGDADLLSCEDIGEDTAQANARLFANSKKLLQAAIWAHQELEAAYSLTHWANPRFEKMIQDKLKQLETEILNSL